MEGDKFAYSQIDNVIQTADGATVQGQVHSVNMDPEETIEAIAEIHGLDPDNIQTIESDGRRYGRAAKSGRLSVGFMASKWNSSWDPKADPTLN